ncbi:MAG: hypothetical protein JWM98_1336 [Thermoleophilia bacterium]|nr:hypothetical protein [Thermoleophilia bacterium]
MRRAFGVALLLAVAAWGLGPGLRPELANAAAACVLPVLPVETGFSVIDGAAPARADGLTAGQAQAVALREPELATARRLRPSATVHVRYVAEAGEWRVAVVSRARHLELASAEVRGPRCGAPPRAVRVHALPIGDYPPRSTQREVIDAAVADHRVRHAAKRWGGVDELRARTRIKACCWEVDLLAPHRRDGNPAEPVIRVDVVDASREVTGVWTGIQVQWRMARGDRDSFGGDINEPGVWLPLFVLFALVAVDWTRLRSWANTDALAVLALGISHEAFQRGAIDWSVPLAVPPMLWLLGRMGWLFARGLPALRSARAPRSRFGRLARRRVPTAVIVLLCVALAGLRIGVTLDGGNVIDVGYAGVAGARLELRGVAPWGHMPKDNMRGDTYGPANYLAYVPATALVDDPATDRWGSELPAATWTAIAADLGCVALLVLVGWRWISRRGAALLAAGWLACPWTALALASGVNDALVALALLGAFAVVPRPAARGVLVGLAAMVKFAPLAVLVPFLHVGARRRGRQALLTATGCAAVVAAGLAWVVWRIGGGPRHAMRVFGDRTLGFQVGRDSPFSPWGLYGWDTAQHVAQAAVVVAILLACVLPRARDAWQVAAGAAAVLVALQLLVSHWFYLYVPWFLGFVLITLVATRERPPVCSPPCPSPSEPPSSPPTGPAWATSSPSSKRPGSTTSTGT